MAPSGASYAITQPFVGFPTVILEGNEYTELRCPVCHANCRADAPFDFIKDVRGFHRHIATFHEKEMQSLELPKALYTKVLTAEQVIELQSSNGQAVIVKKALRKGDTLAKNKPYNSETPIFLYPTIVPNGKEDGGYVELSCFFCNCNAHSDRGSNTLSKSKSKVLWFNGSKALMSHIKALHKDKSEGWSYRKLIEMCGTPITQARFDQLKKDSTGTLIAKVDVTPQNTIDRRGATFPAAKNKKAKKHTTESQLHNHQHAAEDETTTPADGDSTMGDAESAVDGDEAPSPSLQKRTTPPVQAHLLDGRYHGATHMFRLAAAGDQQAINDIAIPMTAKEIRAQVILGDAIEAMVHHGKEIDVFDDWVETGGPWPFPWSPNAVKPLFKLSKKRKR